MDDFDLTQPMSLCYEDEEPISENDEVAILKVPLQDGIPSKLEFSLYNGVNKIGRNESCEVCIKSKVLSKEHAVIEVGGDCFLIYDLNSSNKTWRSKKPLKPNVKYKLEPNDEVRFGSIKTQFIIKKNAVEEGDSGSETGSESMLLLNEEYCAFSVSTPIKKSVDGNENLKDTSGNASTSNALFPKNLGYVGEKKTSPNKASPKKASPLDLENAPTQPYNDTNFSDSGDETDCEDHSDEKTITREKETPPVNSDNVPQRCEDIAGRQTTSSKSFIPKIGDHSSISSKSPKKLSDQVVEDSNLAKTKVCETTFYNRHQKEPECQSLDSNEDLPPTQLNFALQEYGMDDFPNKKNPKNLNIENTEKILNGSLDSLPATQLNIRNCGVDLEIPQSPQPEANDDLPPTQCSSKPVVNKVDNTKNNLLEQKSTILLEHSDDESDNSDDLPPTQPNLALQFSEELNFLQPDDSHNKNSLSQASTSADTSYSRRTAVPQFVFRSGSRHRKSNAPSGGDSGKTKGNPVISRSGKKPLLSCINISVEEGSSLGEDSSVLCPSTDRRSDVGRDRKIKNTDVSCSPTLSRASGKKGKDSVSETPPHQLKESTLDDGNPNVVTSLVKQFSEVSPIVSNDPGSGMPIADPHMPSTSGRVSTPDSAEGGELRVTTPDSAKAGISNYSANYSPKVYKTKLNDLGKTSQESLGFELNALEDINSGMQKNLGKECEDPKLTNEPSAAKEIIPINENRPDSGNEDADRGKRQSKRNKKYKAAKKTDDDRTDVGRSTPSKRMSPDLCTNQKTKKSKGNESTTGSKLPDLSPNQHSHETSDHEDGVYGKANQRRKSKRHLVTSAKDANFEADVLKKMHFESGNSDESEVQSTINVSHVEKPTLEDSSVSSVSTKVSKNSPKKKKDKNDKNIQLLPTRKSKRQKMVLNENNDEDSVEQDSKGKAISSSLIKEIDDGDDFESIPPRKTARRKLLQNESDNVLNLNQEIGFCAFRRSEDVENTEGSLLDSRMLKRRKAHDLRSDSKRFSPFKEQSSKLPQLGLKGSEVSISNSGEHCNIVVQDGESNVVENSKSDVNNEQNSFGNDCSGRIKGGSYGMPKLIIPVQKLPLIPQQSTRTKRKVRSRVDKSEMQNDSAEETEAIKNSDKSYITEKEVDMSAIHDKGNLPGKRQSSRTRRSNKRAVPEADSTDEFLPSKVSLDTSVKAENEDSALTGSKKKSRQKSQEPKSRRACKQEEILHSNTTGDSTSAVSLNSSVRSLRLRLSASDPSTDEKAGASEKCQISVFAKDSVKSLIKLDGGGLGSAQVKNFEGKPSRASRKSKPVEEEESEDKIPEVKRNSRRLQPKRNSKDALSSPPAAEKSKHHESLNSSSVSDSVSDKGTTPKKSKKGRNTKNEHVALASPRSCQQQQVQKPKVMFTMIEDESPQKVVSNLGGKVVEDVNLCTHLVADKLRRTVKALCCIAKGIPLVNTKWIQECKKEDSFVDHVPYLIKDKASEKQYRFELQKTLGKASETPLFSSWSIHVTPKVMPSPEQMKDIIQCAGGKYLPKMPNRLSEKTVVISCAPDLNLCSHAIKCGIPVVGSEFILTGLLQYKINTKSYTLNKN